MAHLTDYGNWMGHFQAKGKKPAEHKGVSDDDDDYENVTLEQQGCPKPPPLPRDKKTKVTTPKQKDRGRAGPAAALSRPPETSLAISVTSDDPALRLPKLGLDLSSAAVAAAFQPPPGDIAPLPKPSLGRGYPGRSMLIIYFLLGICFLMCGVFLTLALLKSPEPQQDSEALSFHLPQRTTNVSQQLAEARRNWEKIQEEVEALKKAVGSDYLLVSAEVASGKEFHRKVQVQIAELQKRVESVCSNCPRGWKWFQRTCYYFSDSTKTWGEAHQFCLEYGAHLVIINTKEEQDFLVKNRGTSRVYWLGMTDQATEKSWVWVDGTSVVLSFWSSGEPNNHQEEDCGTMATDGRWNDITCHMTDYWICEKHWLC
ncbi:C-type lectin domain family 17, member A-like [Carettochelys insculpta]|uniref:C-type lectin domain family 17, member A-like n=1 Tax=Carettochelys insculpta TaxID=44489 RepID=UPI003EC1005A